MNIFVMVLRVKQTFSGHWVYAADASAPHQDAGEGHRVLPAVWEHNGRNIAMGEPDTVKETGCRVNSEEKLGESEFVREIFGIEKCRTSWLLETVTPNGLHDSLIEWSILDRNWRELGMNDLVGIRTTQKCIVDGSSKWVRNFVVEMCCNGRRNPKCKAHHVSKGVEMKLKEVWLNLE